MAERKIKVPFNNAMVDAVDVAIDESNEKWTEIRLADGAILRVKMSVISIARVVGEYDPQGNPQYVMNAVPTMALIDVPEKLKKPAVMK